MENIFVIALFLQLIFAGVNTGEALRGIATIVVVRSILRVV